MQKIKNFTDLYTWKEGHVLVLMTYQLLKKLPKEETYAIGDQIRRCVVSITANIAEGFSRQSKKEKVQFYFTAKGSLTELENHILIVRDLSYEKGQELLPLFQQIVLVHRLLNGLIKTSASRY